MNLCHFDLSIVQVVNKRHDNLLTLNYKVLFATYEFYSNTQGKEDLAPVLIQKELVYV